MQSRSFDAKGTNVKSACIGSACAGGVCIVGAFIDNTYTGNACAEDTCAKGAFTESACAKDVCVSVKNLMFRNVCICSSTNSPYKFAVLNPRLLIDLKLGMFVSFCLRLQINLDKNL